MDIASEPYDVCYRVFSGNSVSEKQAIGMP
jgi:hypothetical protein